MLLLIYMNYKNVVGAFLPLKGGCLLALQTHTNVQKTRKSKFHIKGSLVLLVRLRKPILALNIWLQMDISQGSFN